MLTPWKKSYDQHGQLIKKQRHYFANNGPSNQSYCFSSVRYGCESWTIKKAGCRRIAVVIPFSRGLSLPGIKPQSPTLQADSLPCEPPGKPSCYFSSFCYSSSMQNKTWQKSTIIGGPQIPMKQRPASLAKHPNLKWNFISNLIFQLLFFMQFIIQQN